MYGAIPPIALYAFVAWTGRPLPLTFTYIVQRRGWWGKGVNFAAAPCQQSPKGEEMKILSKKQKLFSTFKNFKLLNQLKGRWLKVLIFLKLIISFRNNRCNFWSTGPKKELPTSLFTCMDILFRDPRDVLLEGHTRDRSVVSSLI